MTRGTFWEDDGAESEPTFARAVARFRALATPLGGATVEKGVQSPLRRAADAATTTELQ